VFRIIIKVFVMAAWSTLFSFHAMRVSPRRVDGTLGAAYHVECLLVRAHVLG
jgi:hypothetical protein